MHGLLPGCGSVQVSQVFQKIPGKMLTEDLTWDENQEIREVLNSGPVEWQY